MGPKAIFTASLCLCACGIPKRISAPPPSAAHLPEEVAALSAKAEELLHQEGERIWSSWTEGTPLDIAKISANSSALFNPETIRKIQALSDQAKTPEDIKALTFLKSHFVGEYLALALARTNERIAELEGTSSFSSEGHQDLYRDLPRLLANEAARARRAALYDAATPAVSSIGAVIRQKEEQLTAELKKVGYPSYEAYGAELRQADFNALAQVADKVLTLTQDFYMRTMDKRARTEFQLPFKQLHRADLIRLFRYRSFEIGFPKQALLSRANSTLQGLGMPLDQLSNLKVDAREIPQKNPRPLALAVRVPQDVRLSVKPAAGASEESGFLHELGHALHYASTRPTRFELAQLGDATAGETFACLFEDLMSDPAWLQEQAGGGEERWRPYLTFVRARKLFILRRTAGEFLYSLAAHRQNEEKSKAAYHAIMSRALGIELTAAEDERHLTEREDFYASADALRASLLAAQLQKQLKTRFGAAWWHDSKAGSFLRALWGPGNSLSATELARLMGEDGLAPDSVLRQILPAESPLPVAQRARQALTSTP